MKSRITLLAATLVCCISCVETNNKLGGSLVPYQNTYSIYVSDSLFIDQIELRMADSLSGFSQDRFALGAVRDDEFGLTTRSAALTLVPMISGEDTLLFGDSPIFQSFHFSVQSDSSSVAYYNQSDILQNVFVYELDEAIDPSTDYNCNATLKHGKDLITKTIPVISRDDSLSFDFTKSFAEKFFSMTIEDVRNIDKFTQKFPGIYLETVKPREKGGRINLFIHQLDYDSDYNSLEGNYAKLNFSAIFDGERKDSCMYFYISPTKMYDIDSLLTNSATGSFPQYALTLTGHETRSREGKVSTDIPIEGGGGLKPVISARTLKKIAEEAIAKEGGDPSKVIINKASLVLPFNFPEDYKEVNDFWPDFLAPCSRLHNDDKVTFMSLTDSSSSDEDQGTINRSLFQYAPDFSYHMQEILKIDLNKPEASSTKKFLRGDYDIWLLIMCNEIVTTVNTASSEMSDYYNYLAYQSYYSSMYGGYSSGYGDSYSNYYSYMMMAAYANQSSTSTSYEVKLDKDRFYKAKLNGPEYPVKKLRPRLELTFSIPQGD